MNRFSNAIKTATRKFYGAFGDEELTSPISRVDIDIINELVEILKKKQVNEVVAIMNNYKTDSDKVVLDKLVGVNNSLSQQVREESGGISSEMAAELNGIDFYIQFNDTERRYIYRYDIVGHKSIDGCGKDNNQFGILLNECSADMKKVPMYANTLLLYDNEEDRDDDIEVIKAGHNLKTMIEQMIMKFLKASGKSKKQKEEEE